VFATTVWDVIVAHSGSFMVGLLVGLVAASRYRIVRVKDDDGDGDR
jgi:uncharacterized protein involved in propanediol utilization